MTGPKPPKLQTTRRRWVGQNIKGTPQMRQRFVREDLRVVRRYSDAYALQEFKWRTYWLALNLVMLVSRWHNYPGHAAGLAAPIRGGQVIGWHADLWRREAVLKRQLMRGRAGISDDRWLRAALLRDKATGLKAWHMTTHFVVGGDARTDSATRQAILGDNLSRFAQFLGQLRATGWPIIGELDANIHQGTAAFTRLRAIVLAAGGTFHGALGVEYTFTIPGAADDVIVDSTWTIPLSLLHTDHEGRGITYRIRRERPAQLP